MNSIKMFGLAALVALMAMAFAGASSAMGSYTALCSADESLCAEKNLIKHVHETSEGKVKILSSLPTIECNVLFLGETYILYLFKGVWIKEYINLAAPLVITGNYTYSSCNNLCTVKEENGPSVKYVLKTGTELAQVTGEGLVRVKCPFVICAFAFGALSGNSIEGHGLGPLTSWSWNGSVVITERVIQWEPESGDFCPEVTTFLTLTTTPLSKTYIST